jgi:hypothetical protein
MNLQKERYINKEIIKDIFQRKKLFAGMTSCVRITLRCGSTCTVTV